MRCLPEVQRVFRGDEAALALFQSALLEDALA